MSQMGWSPGTPVRAVLLAERGTITAQSDVGAAARSQLAVVATNTTVSVDKLAVR
jgi:hypothetical protein